MCACVHQGVPACAWGHLCMCVCTCMTVCTHVCLYPVPCEGALVSDIWSRQALPGTLGLTRLSLSTACGCRGAAGLCGPLGTQLGSPRRPSWKALLQVGGTRRATGSHGRRGILHGAPKRCSGTEVAAITWGGAGHWEGIAQNWQLCRGPWGSPLLPGDCAVQETHMRQVGPR